MGIVFVGMFVLMFVFGARALLGDHLPSFPALSPYFWWGLILVGWLLFLRDLCRRWRRGPLLPHIDNPSSSVA
jgi:hypothetical protein